MVRFVFSLISQTQWQWPFYMTFDSIMGSFYRLLARIVLGESHGSYRIVGGSLLGFKVKINFFLKKKYICRFFLNIHKINFFYFLKSYLSSIVLKTNLKIIFTHYDFKINLKSYLPILVLRLILKIVLF